MGEREKEREGESKENVNIEGSNDFQAFLTSVSRHSLMASQ